MNIYDLAESLSTAQTQALIQKVIDTQLVEIYRKEEPLKGALPVKSWNTAIYYWNQRNRLPFAQAVTEAPPTSGTGSVSATQSNYVQSSVPIGHFQANGDLSKFNIKVATASIENLLEEEMNAATQSMAWTEAQFHIYGNAASTSSSVRPQWDGFETQLNNKSRIYPLSNATNNAAGAGGTLTLTDLDNMIDTVRTKTAAPLPGDDFFFLVSEPMVSKIGRLLFPNQRTVETVTLKQRRDDGVVGHPVVTIEAGIEVPAYRGIPIVATSFLSPQFAMGALTTATAGTDATFASIAARYYAIECVGQYGVSYASATASQAPSATSAHVALTFTAPVHQDAFGNVEPNLLYRVYVGSSAANLSLYGVVSATDASDAAVTQINDLGTAIIGNPGANQVTGAFYGAGAGPLGDTVNIPAVAPTAGYVEAMWLLTRNPNYCCVPSVTEIESEILANVNARSVQYALIGDKALAYRAPLFGAKMLAVATT